VEEDQDYTEQQHYPQCPTHRDSVTVTGMRIRDDGTTLQEFVGEWPPSITIMKDDGPHIGRVEDDIDGPSPLLNETDVHEKPPEERGSTKKGKEPMRQESLRKDDQGPLSVPESSYEKKRLSKRENHTRRDQSRTHGARLEQNEELEHGVIPTNDKVVFNRLKIQTVETPDQQSWKEGTGKTNNRAAKIREFERRKNKPTGVVVSHRKQDDFYRRKRKQAKRGQSKSDDD
jgi:hypothetical protein